MSSIGNSSALAKQQTGEVLPLFPEQDPVPFEEPSQRHEDLEFLRRFRPKESANADRAGKRIVPGPASMSALSRPENFIAENPVRGFLRRLVKKHAVSLVVLGLGATGALGAAAYHLFYNAPAPSQQASRPAAATPPASRSDDNARVTTLAKTARDPALSVEGQTARSGEAPAPRSPFASSTLFAAPPAAQPQLPRPSIAELPPPALGVPEPAQASQDGPDVATTGRIAERSPAEAQQLANFVARGEQLLTSGEVVSARLFFQRAAAQGDPRGARGLARSYDPAVLKGLPVVGLEGNREEADRWYLKAADLEVSWAQAKGRTAP